jgi:CheY-like chemotaxis protein
VWNLLSNAVKFTPRGGHVRVTVGRVAGGVALTVTDTGQGIAPHFLPFVFDKFRQADASTTRQHGGLGLGLAIVKQLVELHGGRVTASSPGPDRGATFVVDLPAASAEASGTPPDVPLPDDWRSLRHETVCSALRQARPTVLAVDDDADALAIIRRVLEDCGACVITAGSAAEGLELLRTAQPHVLLSDIGMPETDGYEFIRQVRALGPGGAADVPAAAVTAFVRSEDRTRAILAGYDTHIGKPVDPRELVAVVAGLAARVMRV